MDWDDTSHTGQKMYNWACDLFPICRSLTGNGLRQTLTYFQSISPLLKIHEIPTGTQVFDWTIPDEWNIRNAYIEDEHGERIVDFKQSTLSVLGYSEPVNIWLDREELDKHLYSLPEQPDLIPYTTSYYSRRWGFCLPHSQRIALPAGKYHAVIDSTLMPGALTYGEIILPGKEKEEVLLSTYVCHPSMANNELSGPVVAIALARWLASQPERRLTYRIVFVPETIGSIAYLSRHLPTLQERVIAGFVLTCIGDERAWSFMPSRRGNTLADRVARHVLQHEAPDYRSYSFLERGSDERQYCSPRIDLPITSIMRSKYGEYPEYHTSADDLSLISPSGLAESYHIYQQCLSLLEKNQLYRTLSHGEPQLGKRGLYPTLSTKGSADSVRTMMNVLAYADGEQDLIGLADNISCYALDIASTVDTLIENDLIEIINKKNTSNTEILTNTIKDLFQEKLTEVEN